MSTYEKARPSHEVHSIASEIRDQYHAELDEVEVTVGIMFAYGTKSKNGKITSPALKHHGVKAAAIVKINGLKARAEGLPDATIFIDGDEWSKWSEDRRRAILDHEFYHLEVARGGEDDEVLSDDLGRPKLKMRPHDFEVGWFMAIANRHGEASLEVEQAKSLANPRGQLLFPWFEGAESPKLQVAMS